MFPTDYTRKAVLVSSRRRGYPSTFSPICSISFHGPDLSGVWFVFVIGGRYCGWARMPWQECGGRRTSSWSQFSLLLSCGFWETELGSPGFHSKCIYLASPKFFISISLSKIPQISRAVSGSGMQRRKEHDYVCDLLKQIQTLPHYVIAMGAPLPKAFGRSIDKTDINNVLQA